MRLQGERGWESAGMGSGGEGIVSECLENKLC
jgi:hypothetical protein